MKKGGFAGKTLYVNLTTGTINTEELDPRIAEKFIGGLGTCIKLASDIIEPGVSPLSPENVIILGTGPLVGTGLPATSRFYSVTKLPETGLIGWSGGGGMIFGCSFKNAGYDHMVIKGRADRPVYIRIDNDNIQICDAGELWGKGIDHTVDKLAEAAGGTAGVIAIGQAGENRVAFSMAFIDRFSTLGRGGFGAVMGSKNLKAIVVKGSKGIKIADRKGYGELSRGLTDRIKEYKYLKVWQDLGMMNSLPSVSPDIYKKVKKKRVACISCPIGDKDIVEIKEGKHKGLVKRSTSAINLFMPVFFGLKDYNDAIKSIALIDDCGMDMFEVFGVLGFAKTLQEKGIIPEGVIDKEIRLDSLDSLEIWISKIYNREGFGDILADGSNRLIREYGESARKNSPPLIKGMLPYAGPDAALPWELFGTMELGQILEPSGPHVGSGGSPTYFAKRPLDVFPKHLTRMGVPREAIERILPGFGSQDKEPELNVGRLLNYSHNWFTILGSLGICARAQINRFYNAELCADLYSAVTGIETSLEELRVKADRVWTLLRMVNIRHGLTRKDDDAIPEKWYGEKPFRNYLTENPLTLEEMEKMIDEYYDERGWDVKTGIPSQEKLKELGLEEDL